MKLTSVYEKFSADLLPGHIFYSKGDTAEAQRRYARARFARDMSVNAAFIRQDLPPLEEELASFMDRIAYGHKRFLCKHDVIKSGLDFNSSIDRRLQTQVESSCIRKDDIRFLGDYWAECLVGVDNEVITKTQLDVIPEYSNSMRKSPLHVHVDSPPTGSRSKRFHDLREIFCPVGPRTIVFADCFLNLVPNEVGVRQPISLTQDNELDLSIEDDILTIMPDEVGFVVPKMYSVMVRTDSEANRLMGATPSSHSFGLGDPDHPKMRVVVKTDYLL